jgi:hypothetical protein
LANLKQDKGERGLATLVSHLHSKINKTTSGFNHSTGDAQVEVEQELSQQSLGIILSPMMNQPDALASKEVCSFALHH